MLLFSNSFDDGSGPVEVSRYEYQYDQLGRRENVKTSGAAFASAAFTHWGYDERNQLDTSDRYLGTDLTDLSQPVAGEKRDYDFDAIGNRETALDQDGVTPLTYSANQLNQYDLIDAATPTHDEDGNMVGDGAGRSLTYSGENRLVGFSDGSATAQC